MITKVRMLIVSIAVFALCLVALGAPNKAVERPLKISGHITMTLSTATGNGVSTDWGECTHLGRYEGQGTGHVNLATGSSTGSGTSTAANGDKIFWVSQNTVITITGGTGRFEGATGEFQYAPTSEVVSFPDANTMIISFTYEGEGTITY